MSSFRIGHGYDVHQLVAGRRCIIGGVEIQNDVGPLGHSDADVLSHAIADSILGAGALPDIGHYFPNTSEACKNMDSQDIIRKAVEEIKKLGYKIANIDCSMIAETPKLAPHLTAIKAKLAQTMGIDPAEIGLKATTNEKMGWIGRREGLAAHAVCLIEKI